MEINCLNNSISNFNYLNTSFVIQFLTFKDIWMFNCYEGCQYIVTNNKLKINNISKIIITDLHINNMSGLLGLLSSLNLIGRTKSLHIYGPKDLAFYLDLSKKYSHTNFNYIIYIHILTTGLIINYYHYRLYAFKNDNQYEFIIMQLEQYGTFILSKAKKNYVIPGPMYGKLKQGLKFVLPDGLILDGKKFTSFNLFGTQVSLILNRSYRRINIEHNIISSILFY
uniref:Ribonuclease Z n=1 Tax=Dipterocladia arabiensis TaxID=2007176 RepID=A0A1Z1M0L9_9FLOR|nr:ribonuclease Z [Dipterocladia arabiensis]ARW59305.1 ribonuclease Z [Dipterocladia arabiensis]